MKAAVVIPIFNHAVSAARVIGEVRSFIARFPEIAGVIVVDDGSTDAGRATLRASGNVTLLAHQKNQGKGAALLTAFRFAQRQGFTHVITMDADGQHDVSDIRQLLLAAQEHPEDLIIGCRDMEAPRGGTTQAPAPIPSASKKGRELSRFWLRVETGQDIPDSQCGLRVYPLSHTLLCRYRFHRFDFETEVLARMAWAGLTIRSVPVACIYFSPAERVSHFRPMMDTLRGVRVNVYLVARRLFPLPFPRVRGGASPIPAIGRWWKRAAWRTAMRQILQAGSSNAELAAAFALGVLVGLTPFYLLQTVLVVYLARRLHLNMLAALLGSQISIPPLAPIWLAVSYSMGNFLLHGRWIDFQSGVFSRQALPALLLGSVVVSLSAATIALFVARMVLSHIRVDARDRAGETFSSYPPAISTPIASPPS